MRATVVVLLTVAGCGDGAPTSNAELQDLCCDRLSWKCEVRDQGPTIPWTCRTCRCLDCQVHEVSRSWCSYRIVGEEVEFCGRETIVAGGEKLITEHAKCDTGHR